MKFFISILLVFLCITADAQQTDVVDFKRVESVVLFNKIVIDSTVFNSYEVKFDILKKTDSIYLDAINMRFENIALNGKSVTYKNDDKKLIIYNKFKASESYKLNFLFFTSPKKAIYFIGWEDDAPNQIWTQGQGKYTSNWLPSLDDTNDKIEFDLTYVAPKGYQVMSNGKMVSKTENPTYNLWEFDMQKPMSSYLVAVVVGKYDKKTETSKSGIPLEMYYYPEDSAKAEPTYRYTKQMFDFLEEEIGVPYPWQNYKQVPVHDFLYAGMENTSCTIFSDAFMVDEIGFNDKNYVNVNAHELAHQWFGNLVTAKSGEHHWLQEGFATYYALLAEREVFGDDYYYWRLYEYAQELLEQDKAGKSTSLLNPKSSSLTFYKKGAWVLHMLREKIGDEAFKIAVKNYLKKFQFKNVETNDFINEVEEASGQDLTDFFEFWIKKNDSLRVSMMVEVYKNSIVQNFDLGFCLEGMLDCAKIINEDIPSKMKERIISQKPELISKKLFEENDIKLRQAIAQILKEIPSELKEDYESLLNDKSYVTIEHALFNLVNNYPDDAKKYLDQTKDVVGFNNKNVRLLWLVLAITADAYSATESDAFIEELLEYTNPKYNFEVRMSAFQYLRYISSCAEKCQENLQQATTHHNWRMVKFAKETLKQINKN